ncbi:MAG: hypothetical protein ACE5KU_03730 [Nitrososphaerales archaeon]
MSTEDVVEASKLLEELEAKYGRMRRVTGTIGKWFSRRLKLFFDCEDDDKKGCAEEIFSSPDLDTLIVYFIVKGQDGHQLRDSRFKNIYGQNLQRMIEHFHTVLEPSIKHGLQLGRLTYVECIGYGAVIEERMKQTISDISEIKRIVEEETGLKYQIIEETDTPDVKILQPSEEEGKPISVACVRISGDTVTLYAPKDKTLEKPEVESGPEWEKYLKSVAWKDAMSLTIREKYYGILVTFDADTTRFKVELNYPVEEEKLRKACHAIDETRTIQ